MTTILLIHYDHDLTAVWLLWASHLIHEMGLLGGGGNQGSKYLLSWADEVTEIKTICHCGRKATFNARVDPVTGDMVDTGEQIEIGGNARYVSVCRKHFYRKTVGPSIAVSRSRP